VKHSYLVRDVKDLAQVIKNSFYIASTGRPGPVVVDLPKDVLINEADFQYPETPNLRGYKPKYEGNKLQIKKAVELIEKAQKPVIYIGGGVIASDASSEIVAFAEKINAPVTTTLMGIGAVPWNHPLYLGMLGMHGTKYANYAVQESDLIIAVGARFDDRVTGDVKTFAPHADIIHIDVDAASIGKIIKVDVPIVGDAKRIVKEITDSLKKKEHKDWVEKINKWKQDFPMTYDNEGDEIKPQFVIEKINELTNGEAIITTEVGQNQMWAAQFYKITRPRYFITSGGLGTMGYGFPAAIGAQIGNPGKIVFDIAGDGSIQMNVQELATAVKYNVPVKVAILNNGYLGMVRQWQELFFGKRYAHSHIENSVDFVKLAEAYGAKGLKATKKGEVEKVIQEALAYNGPVLMDFLIPKEENVWPMVPAGASLSNMLEGELA
ncbi:MAG TPA: biosynthetic-type acetolactate synthase large subunit, partial [Candidatus Goldiibacteriota bacterium]|nr:biosynthetic-type acetolactate synthase large subunit [Candidatus Goldiibacteriota bacterium]